MEGSTNYIELFFRRPIRQACGYLIDRLSPHTLRNRKIFRSACIDVAFVLCPNQLPAYIHSQQNENAHRSSIGVEHS
jgi:hypothetical protein